MPAIPATQENAEWIEDVSNSEGAAEDFYSAMSHVPEDSDIPGLESDSPRSRSLSDGENERLNAKIDRLISVLESGCHVQFTQDPLTDDVDVTTEMNGQAQRPKDNDVEAFIAANPENYGPIISHRLQMMRSPTSAMSAYSSSKSASHSQSLVKVLTPTHEQYEFEHVLDSTRSEEGATDMQWDHDGEQNAPARDDVAIEQAIRALEKELGEPPGRLLARIGSDGVEIHPITPIPIDFGKNISPGTPLILSESSELRRSLPLFRKSYGKTNERSDSWKRDSSSLGAEQDPATSNRIVAWLRRVETPPQIDISTESKDTKKSFLVFKDTEEAEANLVNVDDRRLASKRLKDISNIPRSRVIPKDGRQSVKLPERSTRGRPMASEALDGKIVKLRQPGYLTHNSFAVEKKSAASPKRSVALASRGFEGASDEHSRRSYINSRWPGLLVDDSKRCAGNATEKTIVDAMRSSVGGARDQNQAPIPNDEEGRWTDTVLHPDPERATHFERALARLEGRAAPEETSPIRRYVHNEGVYGEEVEVDLRRVRFRQPQALRYGTDYLTVFERFEQMLGGLVDEGDH